MFHNIVLSIFDTFYRNTMYLQKNLGYFKYLYTNLRLPFVFEIVDGFIFEFYLFIMTVLPKNYFLC